MIPVVYLCRISMYKTAILFVGDCDRETALDKIYKYGGYKTKIHIPETSHGCVVDHDGDLFMWIKDMELGSNMLHELFHAAVAVLRSRGIPLSDDTEEVVAYLLGWLKKNLMDKVYDVRDKLTQKAFKNELDARRKSKEVDRREDERVVS